MTRRLRVSFTITLLTAFALLFVAALGLVVAGYRQTGAQAALETAERSLAQAAEAAAASTRALIRPVLAMSAVLPEFAPLSRGADLAGRDTAALLALLVAEPAVQTVSMGLADGTLRQVLRTAALAGATAPRPPPCAAFALREAGDGQESYAFLDAALHPCGMLRRAWSGPDHRLSSWFLQAEDAGVHVSTLYDLPLVGHPGLSISRHVPEADAVFALDMTLDSLAGFLARQQVSPRGEVFLFTEDGILLAHQNPELAVMRLEGGRSTWTTLRASPDPVLREVADLYAQGLLRPGTTRWVTSPGGPLLVRLEPMGDLAEPSILVAVVAPVADFTDPVDRALREGTLLAGLALLVGLAAFGLLAWRIAAPLRALTQEAEAIRGLSLEGPVPVQSRITEIARLAEAMDGMKAGLRLFGVYVPRDLVGTLMQRGDAARIGGERRSITVMFSDVENFTTLAEKIPPEELMQITSAYFQAVTEELLACHATIDKYIGDAVMALWNAPRDDASHAMHACRAALRARMLTEWLCTRFEARGWPRLRTRFGVHTGEAVVGNIGSTDRMAYTAIGSMVNIGARLEGMNKLYGTSILISEATRVAAGAGFVTRPVDLVRAKGASTPLEVHELLGLAVTDIEGERSLLVDPALLDRLPAWRRLVASYREGRFSEARAILSGIGDPAGDPLTALYAARLAGLAEAPPPGWSPVLQLTTK